MEYRAQIAHGCDGPLTAFVLISRATDLAANPDSDREKVANALYEELTARGFLSEEGGYTEYPGT
jgi:hypothetical protein